MYQHKSKASKTSIHKNTGYKGETIETKVRRIMNNKEPISDGAPLIYTERKDGVNPAHDIRTDRFEIAVEAMDKVTKSKIAKREFGIGERSYDTMTPEQQASHIKKFPESKFNRKVDKPDA